MPAYVLLCPVYVFCADLPAMGGQGGQRAKFQDIGLMWYMYDMSALFSGELGVYIGQSYVDSDHETRPLAALLVPG